ncbi:MAG: trimethylamine methyltransferase family protein [Alphaproteobacteria bacterium]|nr:trimethylamine methyltransferase family protein [Alphaproteobacteria bacterium]
MGTSIIDATPRRRRGRSARREERLAPLANDIRPVRGGLAGGWYRPFGDHDVGRIHQTVLQVLEQFGLSGATASCIELCEAAGAVHGSDGRLRFPRALVEDTIAGAGRKFPLHARNPAHDMEPFGSNVYFGTAGAATQMVDVGTASYRNATVRDLYQAAVLVDHLDNIHFFQRPVTPTDVEGMLQLDTNTLYACLAGTGKHIGTSFTNRAGAELGLELLHEVAGGERAWRERPFVSNSNCFVVPPLTFAEDACGVLETCVRGGMPVLLLSAGQAGATAPAALAGAVVQACSEVLAGLVYVNAICPGSPAIFGTWPFVSDLRTGSMSGGSGEQGLLSAACGQMARFYDLTGGAPAGMSDAKLPDYQAGYEKGATAIMAGLAGLNLVYEAAGMHASLLGFCLESLILDNDLLGQAMRGVRGIEVTEDSLSLEVIREVCCDGPGHYLGQPHTLRLMQREFVYPQVGDRTSPKEWVELGKPDQVRRATETRNRILATDRPRLLDSDLDRRLRARCDIVIPDRAMGPAEIP